MVGIYQAIAVVYVMGGLWGVFAFRYSARMQGYAVHPVILAALAFFLWPLILAQIIFVSIHAYQRARLERARGKCGR